MFGFLAMTCPPVIQCVCKGNIFQAVFVVFLCGPFCWFLCGAYYSVTYVYEFLGRLNIKETK